MGVIDTILQSDILMAAPSIGARPARMHHPQSRLHKERAQAA
jgi:hypothetical protein